MENSLDLEGIPLSVWRIHSQDRHERRLFTDYAARNRVDSTPERLERLRFRHAEAYKALSAGVRPLPGARELLDY